MRQALTLLACGIAALIVQGGLATVLPPPFCPDFALLVVIAVGISCPGLATGALITVAVGYAVDLTSGSLLGEHALLRLLVFAAARLASRQLNLRGSLPLAFFAVGATLFYGAALAALTAFLVGGSMGSWLGATDFVVHALVNGCAAPPLVDGVVRLAAWARGDDAARRALRIDPRTSA